MNISPQHIAAKEAKHFFKLLPEEFKEPDKVEYLLDDVELTWTVPKGRIIFLISGTRIHVAIIKKEKVVRVDGSNYDGTNIPNKVLMYLPLK